MTLWVAAAGVVVTGICSFAAVLTMLAGARLRAQAVTIRVWPPFDAR